MINFLKKNILNIIIIILFIICALYMSNYHELWADEAQSWLIARDLSVPEILSYIKYEGTPPLWVLIIKVFMHLGINYETYYIIPIIFMSLGLLFTFCKYEIPWYIKILFPFTYYVFFQTTIVVRSYSLALLALSLTFYYFPRRYENPWKYLFSIAYLMGISLHTFLISSGFFAISLLFFLKDRSKIEPKVRKNMIIILSLIAINLLIIAIILMPNSNFGFAGSKGKTISYVLGETTLANGNKTIQVISAIIVTTLVLYILYVDYKKSKNINLLINEIEKLFIVFPLIAFYVFFYANIRYFSILFFCIFLFLINKKDIPIIKIFLTLMLCIQVAWNISSCKIDYSEKYAYGKEIHDFLEQIDYKNKTIDVINFHITEIAPYFEDNPFYHSYHTNNAFYSWCLNSGYDDVYMILANNSDIYIIPVINEIKHDDNFLYIQSDRIKTFLSNIDNSKYNIYSFEAMLPQKSKICEYHTFLIVVNNEVDKEIHDKNIQLNKEKRIFTDTIQ